MRTSKLQKNIVREDHETVCKTPHDWIQQLLDEVLPDMRLGRYAVLIKCEEIDKYLPDLKNFYPDVPNVTLKIFLSPPDKKSWGLGDVPIEESTTIQNMFALKGIAPRVYELIKVTDGLRMFYAQVTEDLGEYKASESESKRFYTQRIEPLIKKWELGVVRDTLAPNLVKGKWVDFQDFRFGLSGKYKQKMIRLSGNTQTWQNSVYQDIPELGVEGARNGDRLRLLSPDFHSKTVLDLGCSGGAVCNFASARGAVRVFGVDTEEVIKGAPRVSNFLGHFNIDYFGYDLKDESFYEFMNEKGWGKFDVIIFFSMEQHIGLPAYLSKFMHKDSVIYFESNCYVPVAPMKIKLEKDFMRQFSRVEYVGDSHDFGARALYKLMK